MIDQVLNSNFSESEALLYTIAFTMIKEVPEKQKLNMLRYYKSAVNIFQVIPKNKINWPLQAAENELKFIQKHSIQSFFFLDYNYPERLSNISDPPIVLFLKGSANFNIPQLISIVGTRQNTHQAKKIIQELIEGLNHLQIGIISGLALGVDGIAHERALENNMSTWGVLAHGLDKIYPNQHRRLAINILKNNGGLITECRQNTPTMPYQFPKRNRIVAGMSDATIVIESQIEGGSMITAKLARGYDREVFAVPGKLNDSKSKGCLWLIKNNIATMYYDPIQLLDDMQWQQKKDLIIEKNLKQDISQLNPIELSIFKLIQMEGSIHRDSICNQLGITINELANPILTLELNGFIHLHSGNCYSSS